MSTEQRRLRLYRTLVLTAGLGYFAWWFVVRLSLPNAFNPFLSRVAVVGGFLVLYAASYRFKTVARHLSGWLAFGCCIATAHYFYLFDRNHADLNWVVGSYITVIAVCALLQTARSLLAYSLVVTALSVAMVVRHSEGTYAVFLPGMLTSLVFANVGLRGRLRLVDRLRESHQRIESLFDAGFDGIAVHEKGVILQVNGTLGPLLGRSRDELVGTALPELFAAEHRELVSDMVLGRREVPYEAAALRQDGTRISVEVVGKQHMLDGRQVQQVALRDLTDRKRAQADLVKANRNLESFSYSVAHDLRAPLRAIAGFSRLLLEKQLDRVDAEGKRHLELVAGGAEKMGRLIDALLGLARLTRKEVKRETADLTRQAEAIVKQLRASQPERQVAFSNQPGVTAQGDPQLLAALLDNLLSNAWKFTARQAEPRISFGCQVQGGVTVYHVKDNGAGFDMAHGAALFGPFTRLHSEAEYPGTGIGLATVQRIVEHHGGRVWAEAAVNQGAAFYFTLEPAPRPP